jgi:hypothetical protein
MTPQMLHNYTRGDDGLFRKVVHFPSPRPNRELKWSSKTMIRNSQGKLVRVERVKL